MCGRQSGGRNATGSILLGVGAFGRGRAFASGPRVRQQTEGEGRQRTHGVQVDVPSALPGLPLQQHACPRRGCRRHGSLWVVVGGGRGVGWLMGASKSIEEL